MKGFVVVSKSVAGNQALRIHEKERKGLGIKEKMAFKGLFTHKIIEGDFLRLEVRCRSKKLASLLPFEALTRPVHDAMMENNAFVNIDYEVKRLG